MTQNTRKQIGWRWALLFAFALALRLIHLSGLSGDPWLELPLGDAAGFDGWARAVAAGGANSGELEYQAPLYPGLLSLLYSAGFGAESARFLQALMGAGACLFVALATRIWCGSRAGLVAGLMLACFAPALFYESLLLKCALATFCFSLMLWLWAIRAQLQAFARFQFLWGVALGLTLSALVLSREHAWVLYPVVFLALAVGGKSGVAQESARCRFSSIAGLLLATTLVLLPLGLRAERLTGEFSLGTGNLGPNLYIGNHAGADGLYSALLPGRGRVDAEREDTISIAEAELGRDLSVGEVSRFWRARALDWIAAEPLQAATLFARKLRLATHAREWMDTQSFEVHRERSNLADLLAKGWNFGLLFVFAVHGLALWLMRAREERSLRPARQLPPSMLVFACALLFGIASFFVLGRFRLALVPFLAPLAAQGLLALIQNARLKQWASLARASVWILPATALCFLPIDVEEHPVAESYNNLGSALSDVDRSEEALVCYGRAVRAWPESADARFNRGGLLAELGREEEARQDLLEAVRLEPAYLSDASVLMARARMQAGDLEAARKILLLAINADPEAPGPLLQLGSVLRRLGEYEAAEAAYRRSIALDPNLAGTHNDLGFLLSGTGREEEALAEYALALALEPGLGAALTNLGWLLACAERRELRAGQRALELADQLDAPLGGQSPFAAELRAAALATLERFPEAAQEAKRAAGLALEGSLADLAARCASRARAYANRLEWLPPGR